jgi:hypothetical protein
VTASAVVSPEVSAELVKPTPKEIDTLCSRYEAAVADVVAGAAVLKQKNAVAGTMKAHLIEMTQTFGFRHTQKSNRLMGLHSFAQITTATRVETVASAVDAFKAYLESSHSPTLVGRFFQAHTTYSLVASPAEVLKSLELPARIRIKMVSLVNACFAIQTSAPSLKVETVKAEKP